MWLFVFFDLPTGSDQQRGRAARFRKQLLHLGFTMLQYSVYIRHCGSTAHTQVYDRRIKTIIPPEGHVLVLTVRDSQFGRMRSFWGGLERKKEKPPIQWKQLTLFSDNDLA